MMAKQNSRTYRSAAAAAHAKVMAAQESLEPQEEPMRRYPHPIPAATPTVRRESSDVATPMLEQLQYQSQLLVDLLGAVNSLTAAVLCQEKN